MAKSNSKKAEDAVKLDTGSIQTIAFCMLAISPLNVRKDAKVGADDELVASIRAHGLLQPLVGYVADPSKRRSQHDATVNICAGQRRLLALKHIAEADTPIPVRIVDEATAIEVSLAENLERKDMNPADELAAFQALIDTGTYDGNRIADRFGFDRRYVRRRLKMAVLAPEIIEALRDGKIGIAAAEAYAATDDKALQLKLFKANNRPNSWDAHNPKKLLREILDEGIEATSALAKFIGGVEAYQAEGGKIERDEAFGDLFAGAAYGEHQLQRVRLSDQGIINTLLERAREKAAPAAEKMARKKYPFITGIEWMNPFGQYGHATMPKAPKKSDLVAVEKGWNTETATLVKAVENASKEPDAQVIALVGLDRDGKVEVEEAKFFVTRSAWSKAKPKEVESRGHQETPEERAAREKERSIRDTMESLYARSLVGETPGFGTTRVHYDRYDDRLTVQLIRLEPKGEDIDFTDQWNPRVRQELLEPFREAAVAKVDQLLAEAEEKAKAKEAGQATFESTLAELEKKPIAEWPAVTIISVDMGDDSNRLIIARAGQDGKPVLSFIDETEEPWTSDDVAQSVEVIRDQAADLKASISIFDTVEAYAAEHAGQCRMCGCTEDAACEGGCSWTDQLQTLCSSEECTAKAGVAQLESEAA